ncbi:uncharacterized protein LOC132281406 isoform X2 [Cornus florida]|uniref:uncharacterized protein LOC132281406 isoform X2 n=1 Tax=Cornus florida TaxID=4283 RepID=UPI00289A0F4E|nr:uncharacterized protein LOC132281406 isoform X2 [Cornus florida]
MSITATSTTTTVCLVYTARIGVNRNLPPPPRRLHMFRIHCSDSQPGRGFGRDKNNKKATRDTKSSGEKDVVLQQRKSTTEQSGSIPRKAPGLNPRTEEKSRNIAFDVEFEKRLEAVKRSALEQKKADEVKEYGAIDYDAPMESKGSTIGLGTKIGVGVAVVVFGLVFALGDFLPSGSVSPTEDAPVVNNKPSGEEKAKLQTRLQQYEAMLKISPEDPTALEGAAVTLTELGEYSKAASLLEDLTKKRPDLDALRLLGEVKYQLKDYEGSAAAYRNSAMVSKNIDFEVLRGLTNALLAAKKPDEAVQFLLASRERLNIEKSDDLNSKADSSTVEAALQKVDPIQVELLLGKAYSDWGHVSDAVSVYDRLISSHPNDFRGYLAKGIILKENGKVGDAERMFIQARFFAPEKAKALVDRYSRQ